MSLLNVFVFCGLLSVVFGEPLCPPYSCPEKNACCPFEIPGKFGCCPYEHGVCCPDLKNCCPEGYVCEPAMGGCIPKMAPLIESNAFVKRSGELENEVEPSKGKSHAFENVVLCDDNVYCAIGNTCCRNRDGSFYCCPHQNATCCEHGMNCCPAGATCDASTFMCIQEEEE